MTKYCFYLFGMPRIERDGQTLQVPRRKGLALLAYLAVGGKEHTREHLAALLFPEQSQAAAHANLRRELSELKRILGPDLLQVNRQSVGIGMHGEVWLDTAEFVRRIEWARQVEGNAIGAAADSLDARVDAATLYEADFMQGFNLPDSPLYDEWQFFQADALRLVMMENLQEVIFRYTALKSYGSAVEAARRWLAMDPLHEPAHRELIKLYALSGKISAALRQYAECERLLREELGVAPEDATRQLYAAIKTRQFDAPRLDARLSGLPAPATTFVGREKELRELQQLLDEPGQRMVTILGPGGIGKTRLAIETARLAVPRFVDGAAYISLAAVNQHEQVVSALAAGLGLPLRQGESENLENQLLDYLAGRQMLLVLDNMEHLQGNARLLLALLERTPRLKLLVTSRERLGFTSETVYALSGMECPDEYGGRSILAYDAVALFVQNIRRLSPGFEPDEPSLVTIARICRMVQGTPLALILAAGWTNTLALEEIATEIAQNLDILTTDLQDLPPRQRSMRAVFDYSWELLLPGQRQELVRCCIFQGGFTRQAAQHVAGASIQTLLSLINTSWLQRDDGGRYHLHELVRQYLQRKLEADPQEHHQVGSAHAEYFAARMAALDVCLKGPEQREAFQEIALEYENVRTAWGWLVQENRAPAAVEEILPALFRYSEARARSLDLLQMIGELRQKIATGYLQLEPRMLAALLTAQAAFYRNGLPVRFGIFGMLIPVEKGVLLEAWELAGSLAKMQAVGFWGMMLAYLYGRILELEGGKRFLRQLIDLKRAGWQQPEEKEKPMLPAWDLAFCQELYLMLTLETTSIAEIDVNELERLAEEAIAIFQHIGDERETGLTLRLFGRLRYLQHNYVEAVRQWSNAQERLWSAGEWAMATDLYWYLGDVHLRLGQFDEAFRHYQAMVDGYMERGLRLSAANMLSKVSYEALRYSTVDHALQARLRSLELARDLGDRFTEGWFLWELGEIYRVMDQPEQARRRYEESRWLLEQMGDENGRIYYHRGLGDLALAAEDFPEAENQFLHSCQEASDREHRWSQAYALAGLGAAAVGQGDVASARQYFTRALHSAKDADEPGVTLAVMAGIARYSVAAGNLEQAKELLALVESHPLSWRETKAKAIQLANDLAIRHNLKPAPVQELDPTEETLWLMVDRLIDDLG